MYSFINDYSEGPHPIIINALAAFLHPHEAIVAPKTGHILVHETGAIEATGDNNHLYLYMDGARLGSALCATNNDLQFCDLSKLADEETVLRFIEDVKNYRSGVKNNNEC